MSTSATFCLPCMTRSPRPSLSIFAYRKQSKTRGENSLGTRLVEVWFLDRPVPLLWHLPSVSSFACFDRRATLQRTGSHVPSHRLFPPPPPPLRRLTILPDPQETSSPHYHHTWAVLMKWLLHLHLSFSWGLQLSGSLVSWAGFQTTGKMTSPLHKH